jgi:hypothetical protein
VLDVDFMMAVGVSESALSLGSQVRAPQRDATGASCAARSDGFAAPKKSFFGEFRGWLLVALCRQ